MNQMNRRDFLGRAATTVGASMLMGTAIGESNGERPAKCATDPVMLGRTDLKVSLLGVGTGTSGWNGRSNQTRLGQEQFTRLIRHAYDSGITFFDCADMYGSHQFLKSAIKGIPREKIVIQSKVISRSPQAAMADIERFLWEMGTDYIDSLLIHVVSEPGWASQHAGLMDVFSGACQRHLIRVHGVSCHGIGTLKTLASTPWVDIALVRLNHAEFHMDENPDVVKEILKGARTAGRAVIGSNILGHGEIRGDEEIGKSLKYVLGSGAVDSIVIGFESAQQIDDAISRIDRTFIESLALRAIPARTL